MVSMPAQTIFDLLPELGPDILRRYLAIPAHGVIVEALKHGPMIVLCHGVGGVGGVLFSAKLWIVFPATTDPNAASSSGLNATLAPVLNVK